MPRKPVRLLFALLFVCALALTLLATDKKDKDKDREDRGGSVVIAQLSDIHMGLEDKAPNAAENLQRALEMIAQRHVDAIVVSGDIGEGPPTRQRAKQIISAGAKVPVFFAAGNHDDSAHDTSSFTSIFGQDYYIARVKYVTLVVLDSQLLGNYDNYGAAQAEPLAPEGRAKSDQMLSWLDQQAGNGREGRGGGDRDDRVVIAVQHVPLDRGPGFPQDSKPYWTSQEPYRGRAAGMLHKLGVRDILVGHLHHAAIYKASGFTLHVAPAIGYPIGGGSVGFALHTISPSGEVKTEFVDIQ